MQDGSEKTVCAGESRRCKVLRWVVQAESGQIAAGGVTGSVTRVGTAGLGSCCAFPGPAVLRDKEMLLIPRENHREQYLSSCPMSRRQ